VKTSSSEDVKPFHELCKQGMRFGTIVEAIDSVEYFKTFVGRKIKLPTKVTPELLYFLGVVAGDGSLPIKYNDKGVRNYAISIDKANGYFVRRILKPLAEKLFDIQWSCLSRKRMGRERIWTLQLYSKPLYMYLTKIFDFPEGKKTKKIRMPKIVMGMPAKDRLPYLAGIMDTDWGRIGHNFGTHVGSLGLLKDERETLEALLGCRMRITHSKQKQKYDSYMMLVKRKDQPRLFSLLANSYMLKNPKRLNTLNDLTRLESNKPRTHNQVVHQTVDDRVNLESPLI